MIKRKVELKGRRMKLINCVIPRTRWQREETERIPIPLEAKIENKIEELKQRDIIEPVVGSSKWVSPVVPVLKENGKLSKDAEKSPIQLKDNHICQIVDFARPRAVSLKEIIESSMNDQEILNVKEGKTSNKVWWPRCDKSAENIVKACKGCTLVSTPCSPNPMKRRELPTGPWIDIAIDLMGPLSSGDHLFVVVDYYSRYKEVKICRKITSTEIVEKLKEIFSRLGNPTSITADNGRQFISEEFKSFLTERNITLFNTVPYWPQQNGKVERQNRDILKRLKISIAENKDWKESLLDYLTMYNSTPHSVTGRTTSELFFSRRFRDKLPMINDAMERISQDTEIKDRDQERKEKGKENGDRKRKAEDCDLTLGDKVYIKNMNKEIS
ncbi:Uncharacterized protein K02A2.6 [Eumeta japonica]|uniref:Uncharacterized protein K02A2.6 n=1 Tax=Eumeta variegata TaxID=151549 RepID=A0A4C1Z870_EUMVA|nr:Uncharacterized protein K02A2.6 [Eumeta japonica]